MNFKYLIILTLLLFLSISSLSQSLPKDFKPDFLKYETIAVPFKRVLGTKLVISTTLGGGSPSTPNFFTKKEMKNYTVAITLRNATRGGVYFVKIPKSGELSREGEFTTTADCQATESANVVIDSNFKTVRLNPGDNISFSAATNMDHSNYYPTNVKRHEELLTANPKAFTPQCLTFTLHSSYYSKSRIDDIVNKLNQSTSNTSNDEELDPLGDLIGDLADGFDENVANDANEIDDIDPKDINKAAADVIIITENPDSDLNTETTKKPNYDINLCRSLTQENKQLISEFKRRLQNNHSGNSDHLINNFKSFLDRRQKAIENETLNPDCVEVMKRDWDRYSQESNKILDAQYNKLMQQHGSVLNGLNIPQSNTSSSSGFKPIPTTMTKTYTKPNPSIKSDNFGSGKVAPIKKKVNY